MKFLKAILSTLFGRAKQENQKQISDDGKLTVSYSLNKVVYEKEIPQEQSQSVSIDAFKLKESKKFKKSIVGLKTKIKIKEYLLKNGIIDQAICEEKFKVKSLKNFIWVLRNEGLKIKTQKLKSSSSNCNGVKNTVNYILISES
jgi:hypothetical protein